MKSVDPDGKKVIIEITTELPADVPAHPPFNRSDWPSVS